MFSDEVSYGEAYTYKLPTDFVVKFNDDCDYIISNRTIEYNISKLAEYIREVEQKTVLFHLSKYDKQALEKLHNTIHEVIKMKKVDKDEDN